MSYIPVFLSKIDRTSSKNLLDMDGQGGFKRLKFRMMFILILSLFDQTMSVSSSLNGEGIYLYIENISHGQSFACKHSSLKP